MKKWIVTLLIITLAFSLVACSASEEQHETLPPRDFPEGDYTVIGEGEVYISTPSGTSEDGNVPVLYIDSDVILTQIGLEAWNFNGTALSYIYIDGILTEKKQLADTQTVLTLEGNRLATGLHKVEVVQYENDDPASELITYRSMEYEIKQK